MSGLEIFNKYTSLRDFSDSPEDEYAQLLQTVLYNIGDELYILLEQAEEYGMKIELKSHDIDFISTDDLIMV